MLLGPLSIGFRSFPDPNIPDIPTPREAAEKLEDPEDCRKDHRPGVVGYFWLMLAFGWEWGPKDDALHPKQGPQLPLSTARMTSESGQIRTKYEVFRYFLLKKSSHQFGAHFQRWLGYEVEHLESITWISP